MMLEDSSRFALGDYADALDGASTLDELRDAIVMSVRALIDTNGLAFIPIGPGIPFGVHAAFSHDEFSHDFMRDVTVAMASITDRDLGGVHALFARKERTFFLNETLASRRLERTEMFNEHWRRYHMERQLLALFGTAEAPLGLLAVGRTARRPPFSSSDVACLEAIRLRVHPQLERLVHRSDDKWGVLGLALAKGLPMPAALFDSWGRLVWASAAAERELGTRAGSTGSVPSPTESEWRTAALGVITRQATSFSADDLLVQRVELSPGVSVALVTRRFQGEPLDERVFAAARRYRLTPRESAVLLRLGSGLSNKEIALDLGCGLRTVDTHVSSILRKFRCVSRTELIAKL